MRSLILLLLIPLFANANTIPKNAYEYIPVLNSEVKSIWPTHPFPHYFGGLIEHESCITLTHSRCWSPNSQLKTKREEGAGLTQLTRAYDESGRLRFDMIASLKSIYSTQLKELSWENVYQRPDLQIRAMLLLSSSDYKNYLKVEDELERIKLTDAAYNRGAGNINKQRRLCGLKPNCNPDIWLDVSSQCVAKTNIYGRTACQINAHHVDDVINKRMPKYRTLIK